MYGWPPDVVLVLAQALAAAENLDWDDLHGRFRGDFRDDAREALDHALCVLIYELDAS